MVISFKVFVFGTIVFDLKSQVHVKNVKSISAIEIGFKPVYEWQGKK